MNSFLNSHCVLFVLLDNVFGENKKKIICLVVQIYFYDIELVLSNNLVGPGCDRRRTDYSWFAWRR